MSSRQLLLDLDRINSNADYLVSFTADQSALVFITDKKVEYTIIFVEHGEIVAKSSLMYSLALATNDIPNAKDNKIRNTIIAVVEEFFNVHTRALLYICDVRDAKQLLRDRLFKMWFSSGDFKEKYIREAIELEDLFGAIIYLKCNPYKDEINSVIERQIVK